MLKSCFETFLVPEASYSTHVMTTYFHLGESSFQCRITLSLSFFKHFMYVCMYVFMYVVHERGNGRGGGTESLK